MKKTITFLSFFLFSILAFSQNYFPMPTDSASWTYIGYGFGTTPPETTTTHYGIQGDTSINGLTYGKLYVNPGQLGFPNPEPCFNAAAAIYPFYIREDGDKKVWVKEHPDSTDILIYDFGLDAGDTFCFPTEQPATGTSCFEVAMVDSILINGNLRRQIHFEDDNGNEQWIEGIGSMTDLIFPAWTLIGNVDTDLGCFYQNDKLIFGDSTSCTCVLGTDINPPAPVSQDISIYPNPFQNFTTINLQLNKKTIVQLQIINTLGQIVSYSSHSLLEGNNQIIIDQLLNSGIYFIQLSTEDFQISKRIIKQ